MFAFIARQPVLDREKEVFGYELLFRDGKNNCYPDIVRDNAINELITKNYLTLGLDDISCNKKSFISFHAETLLQGIPPSLDRDNVIVELYDEVLNHDSLLSLCKDVKSMGFKLVIDAHRIEQRWKEFLPYIDMVKVNTKSEDYDSIVKMVNLYKNSHVQLIANSVETQQDFTLYRGMGFDYFQGYFFSRPEVVNHKNLPTSKLTLIELMGASSNIAFDIESINGVIEHDVGLSYMLLRFINNPTINKRYQITSLRHALAYMGEVEIKKFVAILALANLSDDKPSELIHLSLVRAKFCDLVGTEKKIGTNPPLGFLVGLFSLLDALLDKDMKILVDNLPLLDEVKVALCGGQNDLAMYLLLVKAFESGNWLKVIRIAKILELDQKRLHSLFNEAIVWGNGVRKSISQHFPESKT